MTLLDRGTGSRRRVAGRGLPSARGRFERRAAKARRRPRLVAGVLAIVLLLGGGLVWLGWFSTVLTATAVEVHGVPAAAAAEVRRVAAVPLGGPLLRVDTEAASQRLVAGRQWSEVAVSRSLPHTVVIEVTPRVAVLAVRNPRGEVDVVDRDGFVFRTVPSAPAGVPLVSSGAAQVSRSGVTAALQALGSLDAGLRSGVSGVTVSSADQVRFTLTTSVTPAGSSKARKVTRTVVWGGAGDGERKARLVRVLLGQPGSTIDVSVPSSPVTR